MKRARESGAAQRKKKKAKEALLKEKTNKSADPKSSEVEVKPEKKEKKTKRKINLPVQRKVIKNQQCSLLFNATKPTENTDNSPQITASSDNFFDDIGNWPDKIDDDLREELVGRSTDAIQHMNVDFNETSVLRSENHSSATLKGGVRRLTRDWFFRTLKNGEVILRIWMAYSPSKSAIYCICCRLFENVDAPGSSKFYSSSGFNTWWKLNPKVGTHESSVLHNTNFFKWKLLETKVLKDKDDKDDVKEQLALKRESKKWHEVHTRMVDIIRFLVKQNLSLNVVKENKSSGNKGNFIELMHLMGKYDPALREFLVKLEMHHKNPLTYMSPEIQNDFIAILGNKVRENIISQVQTAKYFSLILDSNPDISYKEHMSLVLRYLVIRDQEVEVVESFIDFIETNNKTDEDISNLILDKLKTFGLKIIDCKSHASDIAAVTVGRYSGVKEKLKAINSVVELVTCSNHLLNLVCLHAASVETNSLTFFGTLDRCFDFFSLSSHRWDELISATGVSLRKYEDTRWSARCDAVDMARNHYKAILTTLEKQTELEESLNTRTDAGNLLTLMQSFSFLCFLDLWKAMLNEVNDVQKYFQSEGINVRECTQKLNKLQADLISKQDELVDEAVSYAKKLCIELGISMEPPRHLNDMINGQGKNSYILELKLQLFSSLDKVINEIRERFLQLRNLSEKFEFMEPAKLLDTSYNEFKYLDNVPDIDIAEFNLERARLTSYAASLGKESQLYKVSSYELLKFILQSKLETILPNLLIMLRIFITIAISSGGCDKSFVKFKYIKQFLQSTMSTEQVGNLGILTIEKEVTSVIDMDTVVKAFPYNKI